jgi:dephospho-CoA kinase
VRRSFDIVHMETEPDFYFVYVEASPETRYERLTKRRQNTDDATKTLAQFEKDALLESETQIRDLKERADFVVNNDGTLEELQKQIDDIVAKIRKE